MADVTLVLRADNTQYVNKLKEAQQANQKLYDSSVSGGKREKGILEEIDATLLRLEKNKRKAFTYEDIEKYNKRIAEAKQHLEEYEKAGTKVEQKSESMIQSIGKWVTSLGIAATALNLVKEAFLKTEQGMALFAQGAAVLNKILSNLVNDGISNLNKGLAETIIRTKQLHELNRQQAVDNYENAKLQKKYNELLYQAADATKKNEERIKLWNQALKVHNELIDKQITDIQKRLKIAMAAWEDDPTNGEMRDEVFKLKTELENLDSERVAGTRRVLSQMTSAIEEEKKRWDDALNSISEGLDRAVEEENNTIKEQQEQWLKYWEDRYDKAEKLNESRAKDAADKKKEQDDKVAQETEDYWDFILDIERKNFDKRQKVVEDQTEAWAKAEEEAARKTTESKKVALEESLRLAAMTADLISVISTNQMNKELSDLERKKQMLLDIASINGLTKEEEVFIYEETERQKLEIEKKYRRQQQALAIAMATIDGARAIAKTFAEYGGTPIAWVIAALVAAQIAVQIAIIKKQKFAKGGWTGEGTVKDETGERVAGVVHEKEFVIKKGQASKYREVLEAINKDDRKAVYNSFTKLQPEIAANTVNNVTVENSGPNNRLDRINNQLYQLNRNLSPKKQVKEEIIHSGNSIIIHRGNSTRVIKR